MATMWTLTPHQLTSKNMSLIPGWWGVKQGFPEIAQTPCTYINHELTHRNYLTDILPHGTIFNIYYCWIDFGELYFTIHNPDTWKGWI